MNQGAVPSRIPVPRNMKALKPAESSQEQEGFVNVTGGRVWYRIVERGSGTPLLTLHGGPGVPHDYLEPLEHLGDERPVVFYDQLGCGRSERPSDSSLWRVDRFVEELAQVRAALGLERIHLLGQSWGTMLATEYLLTGPAGVRSVMMANPAISVPRFIADVSRLRRALPEFARKALDRCSAREGATSAEYQVATLEFYRRHVCRLDPWPDAFNRSVAGMGAKSYEAMWGPNEFTATGVLKDFDRTARLGEIKLPMLFLAGRYDETTPEAAAYYQSLVPGSELVIFEKSSHMPQLEETERYLAVVRDFLARSEKHPT
jgi:proline-specific peptidase